MVDFAIARECDFLVEIRVDGTVAVVHEAR